MTKVMISVPSKFLKEIDKAAEREYRNRSELIRESIRNYLIEHQKTFLRPLNNPKIKEAFESLSELKNKWKGKWNSANLIREMRDKR